MATEWAYGDPQVLICCCLKQIPQRAPEVLRFLDPEGRERVVRDFDGAGGQLDDGHGGVLQGQTGDKLEPNFRRDSKLNDRRFVRQGDFIPIFFSPLFQWLMFEPEWRRV